MLYQVVEKAFSQDGRNFLLQGGLWHLELDGARRAAAKLAPISLAHRMFIVECSGKPSAKASVVEEVELASLLERLALMGSRNLARRCPARVTEEAARQGRRAELLHRLAAAGIGRT